MQAVNTIDGIAYGFKQLLYGIGVIIIGLIVMSIGLGALQGGTDAGSLIIVGLFSLAGMAVMLAGMIGVSYKVIADAVATGNQAAAEGQSSKSTATKVARKVEE